MAARLAAGNERGFTLSYFEFLYDWPSLFAAASIPTLLLLLTFVALGVRTLRWKSSLCLILGYLVIASFVGLIVYQWVPAQYTRDQTWSWPPVDERSLGFTHGKRLAIAADKGVSAPASVYGERAGFFRGWILGPTMVGLAVVVFVTTASMVVRMRSHDGGERQLGL